MSKQICLHQPPYRQLLTAYAPPPRHYGDGEFEDVGMLAFAGKRLFLYLT